MWKASLLTGYGFVQYEADDRLRFEDLGGKIKITYRMKRIANLANLAFFLIWSLPFFAVFIWLAIDRLTQGGEIWPLFFLVPFMIIGALAINHFLFGLIGKMIIELEGGAMTVYKKPRQIRGRRSFAWGEIKQIYVKDDYIQSSGWNRSNARTLHAIMAETSEGKQVKIIGGIELAESASKIERAIEDALRIKDERMAKESPQITVQRMEEHSREGMNNNPLMQKALLTKASIGFRPYYYLRTEEGGKIIGSLLPKGRLGINKQIVWTAAIVGIMLFIIMIMIIITSGFTPQLLFLPLVFVGIMVFAILSTGTMRYEAGSGSYIYTLGRKVGSLNTMEWRCLDESDGSCKMTASGNEIKMADGGAFFFNAGTSFRSGYQGRSSNSSAVNISIFRKEGDEERPVLLVDDTGNNSVANGTFLLDSTEKNIDQLVGFAVFLFHSYNRNMSLPLSGRSGREVRPTR